MDPKFAPLMVKPAPTGPCVRLKPEMLGPTVVTVNATPLLAVPSTVTTTLPLVAPLGTGTTMLVVLQLMGVPARPLKVTLLEPWLAPKFAPLIVTEVPRGPDVGLMPEMLGAGTTVKVIPLLWIPATVTTTGPVVAPAGTEVMMLVALQFDTVAEAPLNVTVLVLCVEPKLVPVIVSETPAAPLVWLRLVMVGADPPAPFAGLNEARTAPHALEVDSVAEAEVVPAAV